VQLQGRRAEFDDAGVALFAISYDPVPVLAAFANKHGITFDLLSDERSRVIQELGLLNMHNELQAAHYGLPLQEKHRGLPYPGTIMLDRTGRVVKREFEQSYRVRPQVSDLLRGLRRGENSQVALRASKATDSLAVTVSLPHKNYHPFERLRLCVTLSIAPGLHIYAEPTPPGYTALNARLEPVESLHVDPAEWPPPRPLKIGSDEFMVYEGLIEGVLPFFLEKNLGRVALDVRLDFQGCTETECYPPEAIELSLEIEGKDLIRD
jgi:peroxiredoxin